MCWKSAIMLSPLWSMGDVFSKKDFHGDKLFQVNLWRVVLHGGTNDQIMPRGGEFHKYIFQQSEHCKSENFPKSWWDIHLKIKPWPFHRIMEGFILKVYSWVVSKVVSCSIYFMLTLNWGINILFEKLTPEIGGWIREISFAHYASGKGDFMQSLSSFLISLVVTCTLMP